jgi:hypothetical protein
MTHRGAAEGHSLPGHMRFELADAPAEALSGRSNRVALGMKLDICAARCGTYSERSRARDIDAGDALMEGGGCVFSPLPRQRGTVQ